MPLATQKSELTRLVLTVCRLRDLEKWLVISRTISSRVEATAYLVAVPDLEIPIFKRLTKGPWSVVGENTLIHKLPGLSPERLRGLASAKYGWYAQQFAKMGGVLGGLNFDEILIWDSDTLPMKKFPIANRNSGFYGSAEFHQPYFTQINRFLGLEKMTPQSFIAQVMSAPSAWFSVFFEKTSERHGSNWGGAMLETIDFTEDYAFSEYETFGTFFSHHFPNQVFFNDRNWSRNGRRYFGDPRLAKLLPPVGSRWDFISFENWQEPWWRASWPFHH